MSKITISAPNSVLRIKVARFIMSHHVCNVEWGDNLAVITYYR